ncbi:MAG TPA: flagellar protein FlgN [Firmicutes bacterium]|nr:flagellar protein FlgN [Bacillota bacterium]
MMESFSDGKPGPFMIDTVCLREILDEEVEILEGLLGIEEKLGSILLEGDARALHSLNFQKEELIRNLISAEKRRRGLLTSGLTLREIISKEASSKAGELESLRRRLLQLQSSLQRQQKINRHLLKHNLRFLEHILDSFFPHRGDPHYASTGELKHKHFLHGLLDFNA